MAQYAILIYEDPAFYANASPEAWGAVLDAHSTFVKQVSELGGSLAGGAALAPTTTATTPLQSPRMRMPGRSSSALSW